MPIMDGLELLKRIQDQPHIKFIILSGYSDFQFIRTAIKYGAFDYILKPIQPEELAGVLLRAVEDIEAARQQAKKEIDLSLDIREKLLGKYAPDHSVAATFVTQSSVRRLLPWGIFVNSPPSARRFTFCVRKIYQIILRMPALLSAPLFVCARPALPAFALPPAFYGKFFRTSVQKPRRSAAFLQKPHFQFAFR